ncbi:O-antigen ligase family protein [Sphingomonas sp. CD22]|uniref:O-antigen ligase family protein n=1 Tax=Sphingomonas sp. CD22 TaxID=3100214 RepID=UPI002ADF7F77|nr:O-antigen ligase family protein [Sphingomonas sp. CD22]MEA1085861.1 O-antigen ligase family protein [Sphingomonas sp. CD22]
MAIAVALWRMDSADRARARPFALAVVALGVLMVVQLIPLPPGLWRSLPGRAPYADALTTIGLGARWRPISMAPDLTLYSLMGLLPVLAAALMFAPLRTNERLLLLDTSLGCLTVGALLSVAQVGAQALYFYDHTDYGLGVGSFANRNHQALFLAVGILLILCRWRIGERRSLRSVGTVVSFGAVAAILPLLVVTGSRAGLAAGILAFVAGALVLVRDGIRVRASWQRWLIPTGTGLAIVVALAIGAASSRELALHRLLTSSADDLRAANLPALFDTIKAFFPIGSGYGTFDAVFRRFESDALLRPSYFNHAHNELIEALIEGGLAAAALLAAGTLLLLQRVVRAWRSDPRQPSTVLARTAALGIALLLLGSLVDYPLRTGFLAVLLVLLATWLVPHDTPAP